MAAGVFQNFNFSKAFKMRLQPIHLSDRFVLDRHGLYLLAGFEPENILRYFLLHDTRKAVYLPRFKGEKEVGRDLMGFGEKLPPQDEVRETLLKWKENEGRLVLFYRSWVETGDLKNYLEENQGVGIVLIDGLNVLSRPGDKMETGVVLNSLRRLSRIFRIGVVVCREPGLEDFTPLFDGILEHGQAGKI